MMVLLELQVTTSKKKDLIKIHIIFPNIVIYGDGLPGKECGMILILELDFGMTTKQVKPGQKFIQTHLKENIGQKFMIKFL